jgi:hypothetical protein
LIYAAEKKARQTCLKLQHPPVESDAEFIRNKRSKCSEPQRNSEKRDEGLTHSLDVLVSSTRKKSGPIRQIDVITVHIEVIVLYRKTQIVLSENEHCEYLINVKVYLAKSTGT